jgi:chromosome segregation ATPase
LRHIDGESSASLDKVAKLWSEVLSFRRQFTDLKMSTQRDLVSLRSDMSQTGKKVTSACLDVYSTANYVQVNGSDVHVGTQQELWTQLQRCRVDKKVLEHKITILEEDSNSFKSKTQALERSIKDERCTNESISKENDKLRNQVVENQEEMSILQDFSAHTDKLEVSLFDIAQMVEDDAHQNEQEDEVDKAMVEPANYSVFVRPTTSPKVTLRSGYEFLMLCNGATYISLPRIV